MSLQAKTGPDAVPAEARSVVRVSGVRCGPAKKNFALTGFYYRWNDHVGVLTALHGVAGCEEIRIRGVAIERMIAAQIGAVDITRDVAWLASTDLTATSVAIPTPSTSLDGALKIVGYPQGLGTPLGHEVVLQKQRRIKLNDLLVENVRSVLAARHSPDVETIVLSLSGPIQPGHSGAPILRADGGVIAVGNGGLKEGMVSIGWAIELATIKLVATTPTNTDIQVLARRDAAAIFAITAEDRPSRHDLYEYYALEEKKHRATIETCNDDKERSLDCQVARVAAENARNKLKVAQDVTLIILNQFDALEWSQTFWGDPKEEARIYEYYKERVMKAVMHLDQLTGIAGDDEPVAAAVLATRNGVARAFYAPGRVDAVPQPEQCVYPSDPYSARGWCIQRDAATRKQSVRDARAAVTELAERLNAF